MNNVSLRIPEGIGRCLLAVGTASVPLLLAVAPARAQTAPPAPAPTPHTQEAKDPTSNFTARWTRADARQIMAMSSPNVTPGQNSLPQHLTMPDIPANFPQTNDRVWVWDTWPLTDAKANQYSYKGWEIIFSLTADRNAGYTFDDRHIHARIGYFYRRAGIPASRRPANGGWIYGGHLFPDGSSVQIFGGVPMTHNAEWSGSTRIMPDGRIVVFYTATSFNRSSPSGGNITPPIAIIAKAEGRVEADHNGVRLTGFNEHMKLLEPDGTWYQTGQQNEFFSFRDPFTFEDPANPGVTFMVFEGNTAGPRGARTCTEQDLGYAPNDPQREDLNAVMDSGAVFQKANVGLAVAINKQLSRWVFLPPILSANCVNDQTERPQIYIKDGKYYLFTISHRSTYAAGVDGPDGVYGFVGNGVRSDYQPLNNGSGLVLGNPTDMNRPRGEPFALDPTQNPRTFQSYSHYVMPGGLVESFIDAIGARRGGSLAPTVRIDIQGANTAVDRSYGVNGLGGYGDIPANREALFSLRGVLIGDLVRRLFD